MSLRKKHLEDDLNIQDKNETSTVRLLRLQQTFPGIKFFTTVLSVFTILLCTVKDGGG